MEFSITKIIMDKEGETYFEQQLIPLNDKGEIGFLSNAQGADRVIFRKVGPEYDFDFHTAPARQYVVLLDGKIEIETSRGDKKVFEQGDILLLEDVEGKGHRTKNLLSTVRSSLFIELMD